MSKPLMLLYAGGVKTSSDIQADLCGYVAQGYEIAGFTTTEDNDGCFSHFFALRLREDPVPPPANPAEALRVEIASMLRNRITVLKEQLQDGETERGDECALYAVKILDEIAATLMSEEMIETALSSAWEAGAIQMYLNHNNYLIAEETRYLNLHLDMGYERVRSIRKALEKVPLPPFDKEKLW